MLKGIDKLLTGELLKALCDMGHGDELVIADANFPAETVAKWLIRVPGVDGVRVAEAVLSVFPLDTYVDTPAYVMDLTDSDKAKGMPEPVIWGEYAKATGAELGLIERFAFYERAKNAYLVIQFAGPSFSWISDTLRCALFSMAPASRTMACITLSSPVTAPRPSSAVDCRTAALRLSGSPDRRSLHARRRRTAQSAPVLRPWPSHIRPR